MKTAKSKGSPKSQKGGDSRSLQTLISSLWSHTSFWFLFLMIHKKKKISPFKFKPEMLEHWSLPCPSLNLGPSANKTQLNPRWLKRHWLLRNQEEMRFLALPRLSKVPVDPPRPQEGLRQQLTHPGPQPLSQNPGSFRIQNLFGFHKSEKVKIPQIR